MGKIINFRKNAYNCILIQFLLVLFFLPCTIKAEEYRNNVDTLFGTNDSRMVVNIVEEDNFVELQVMAVGPLRAQSYSLSMAYNSSSLALMYADQSSEVPTGSYVTGNIIAMQPVVRDSGYLQEVMAHSNLTNRNMRSVRLTVTCTETDEAKRSAKNIKPVEGELLHVFSVFLKKNSPGTDLNMASDLGFYYNYPVPLAVTSWSCNAASVQPFVGKTQTLDYINDTLFTYRSPSSVVTDQVSAIAETSATLNGTFYRGAFNPTNTIINDGNSTTRNNARLDYDTVRNYGFIYGRDSLEVLANLITKKLTIEGTEYDFPDAAEIAAGTFTRDEMVFHIVSFDNTTANKDVPYEATLTDLSPGTTYHVWAYSWYSFQTSDTYLNVGDMVKFKTEGQCIPPELPIALAEQSFCDGATVGDLVVFAGDYDVKWYSSQNVRLDLTDLLIDGETYFAQVENDCDSVRSAITVNIIEELVAPTVTTPQIFCPGSLVSDLRAEGDSIVWYDAPTGGNIVDPSEMLADGFYYAAQKINNCESGMRSEVKVVLEETILDAPVIASPQNFCDFATLADIATDGSNILWYSANGALLPSSTALSNATVYYAAYAAGTCESAERTPVLVYTGMDRFIDAPVISSPQRFCEGATIQNIEVPNNQIIWYASETGNTQISQNTILSHDMIYYAAQKAGECESTERTPVRILFENPQGPEALSPQMFCGTDYTLADLQVTGAGIVWYDAATGGNLLPSSTALTTNPTMYYAAESAYQCESSRVGILAHVNAITETPVISGNLIACADEETIDLTAVVETQPNITYTYFSDEGNTVIEDPKNVPAPSANSTYYVKASNGTTGCESESLGEINVVISNPPVVSVTPAGAYTQVNDFVTLTITDNNTNPAAGAKTATILDESIASIELVNGSLKVTGRTRGNTEVVYTSVNENGCTTELIIPVQVEGLPTGILTGKDIIVCSNPDGKDTTTVQIAYVMGGVAPWTITVSDDRGTFSKDTVINSIEDFPVNMVVEIPKNTSKVPEFTTYIISNIVDDMGGSKQTHYGAVRIGTNPTPVVTDIANANQSICAGGSTLPISFNGISTIYKWSIDQNIGIENYSSGVIPSFVTINETTDTITAIVSVTPEYWYNGLVCIGEPDTAYIVVLPTPKANFIATVGAGTTTVDFTDRSSDNVVAWEWDFGDGETSGDENPTHEYAASGIYIVTLTVSTEAGCTAIMSREIRVNVSSNIFVDFKVNNSNQCLSDNEFFFTDRSTVSTLDHYLSAWLWNFGDGSTSTERNPSHTYAVAGTYTVTLTVTEMPSASQNSVRYAVTVIDVPEITDGDAPEAICAGERLSVSLPEISWNGNTPVAGQWLLNGRLFDPASTTLTSVDNGKLLQYRVETSCGVAISEGDTIHVYGAPEIVLENTVIGVCGDIDTAQILYTVGANSVDLDLYYKITFSEAARRAGFKDVASQLLTGDTIKVAVPSGLNDGYYGGVISVQAENGCQSASTYSFDISKGGSIVITKQPTSYASCEEEEFVLSVEATGAQLTYQWYRNGELLAGETSSQYVGNGSDESEYGEYYVKVIGSCGSIQSETVTVRKSTLDLLTKWNDVIFVSNKEEQFVAYQWYRDNQPIAKDGQYQSYAQNGGLKGTYKVLVTYADGTTQMSCPTTLDKTGTKRGDILVYPNPVNRNEDFTIDISQFISGDVSGVKVEIFDVTGRLLVNMNMESSKQKVRIDSAWGTYVIRLTTPQNEVIIKNIIVAQ